MFTHKYVEHAYLVERLALCDIIYFKYIMSISFSNLFSSDGSSLSGWTNSGGITINTSFGNPAPSFANILLLGKSYLEKQNRPEEFTRKVVNENNKRKKVNSCFIKVVNEITFDGNLLIYLFEMKK
jgi:hypothetical protein